mmetsp:Transcript_7987/g.13270  ORF Transcript_7987/g.13270 Transcript_7987/m.13270 type:complete len:226 (+) Transcript_7987:33-710(+)
MKTTLVLLAFLLNSVCGFDLNGLGSPKTLRNVQVNNAKSFGLVVAGSMAGLLTTKPHASNVVYAVQGSIKTSTVEESKSAVTTVKKCLDGVGKMDALAAKGDYAEIGKLLSAQEFQDFEKAATVLVRSDALTADEKVALGTIKRYGLVADAIIMIGGLGGELRSGGIKVAGGGSDNGIESDSDEDESDSEDEKPKVNGPEVKKYIKLSKDSLSDVYKIVAPIMSK